MKKIHLLLLAITLLFVINGCSKDEDVKEEKEFEATTVTTDISVTSSESHILWIDRDDLTQQLENVLTYNYGNASENEIEKTLIYNNDSTQVKATINFKKEFQDRYKDSNIDNNSEIINLFKESDIPLDNNLSGAILGSQLCEMVKTLNGGLGKFNINHESIVCIPITFHIPTGINISQSALADAVHDLNINFLESKITFKLNGVKTSDNSTYFKLNTETAPFNNDVANNLNIYIARLITDNVGNTARGRAHFPTEGKERVYILDTYINNSKDMQSTVLTHEVGHFFSLLHTFEKGSKDCPLHDDGITDTPLENILDTGVAYLATHYGIICNAINPDKEKLIDNFMSYSMIVPTLRNCDRIFTPQQHNRIRFAAKHWKQHLFCQSFSNQSAISLTGDLSFDSIEVGSSDTKGFTIKNIGNKSFNVTDITSSNSAFSIINGQSATIQPNNSINVQIKFTPTQEEEYNGIIIVETDADNVNMSNDPDNTIQATGTGVDNSNPKTSTISLTGNLNFDSVEVGSSATKTFEIKNTGDKSFDVTSINFPSDVYTADWNSGIVTAGGSKTVTVTFKPTNAQPYNGNVTVISNAENGKGTIPISGNGKAVSSATISLTGNLNFDSVEVGSSATKTFEIKNTGDKSFDVTRINFPSDVYTADWNSGRIDPGAGGSKTVTVTFKPTKAQSYNGNVTVISNADSGEGTIPISGNGKSTTATSSTISLSGNLDFGDIEVNKSATRTLKISNDGSTNFEVSSITNPLGFSSNYSGIITAGNYVEVTVTFTPTNQQNYNGTITVNSNADNGNNEISCFGNGIDNNPLGTLKVINNTSYRRFFHIKKQSDSNYDDNNEIVIPAGEIRYYYNLEAGVYNYEADNSQFYVSNNSSSGQVNITGGSTTTVNINL